MTSPQDPVTFPLLRNRLKERLTAGQLSICLRTTLVSTTEIAFIAHAAGFDALYVDLEHCTASLSETGQVCAAATALGLTSLVRLSSASDTASGKLLDAGSQGIIAPHVDTPAQARDVVAASKFPPLGDRSAPGPTFQLGYASVSLSQLGQHMNDATLVVVMLESQDGIDNAAEIASVDGVDMVLVGTSDLTYQLGVPGEHGHPVIRDAYQKVADSCAGQAAFGVAGVSDLALIADYVALGARFVSAGRDVDFLLDGARKRVDSLRSLPRRTA